MKNLSPQRIIVFTLFCAFIALSNSGFHRVTSTGGYTGAPGDNVCASCHGGNSAQDGTIEILDLPADVMPGTTYTLTLRIEKTQGNSPKAGFQMVSLFPNTITNAGSFAVPSGQSGTSVTTAGGKQYYGHMPAANFVNDVIEREVEWTAPTSGSGDITIFAASIIANNNGSTSGDKFIAVNATTNLLGGAPLAATFSNVIGVDCFGDNNGRATANVTGGQPNFSYAWPSGETSSTATMLAAGDNTVTITDGNSNQIFETVTIPTPPLLVANVLSIDDASCFGINDGAAVLSVSGGTPNYFVDWGNGITGISQQNLSPGDYNVTVTDLNGCTNLVQLEIDSPEEIVVDVLSQVNPLCNGESNGSISVNASGGNGGFSYSWITNNGTPNGSSITDLPSGSLSLEVFDSEGCFVESNFTLTDPSPVNAMVSSQQNISCFGAEDGSATVLGSGGTGSFSYSWSNGTSGSTAEDLAPGTYLVTVTDQNDCETELQVDITQPAAALELSVSVAAQPSCGSADGVVTAFASFGTSPYSFLWSNGNTTSVLSDVPSGLYSVTVTDENDCTQEQSLTLADVDGVLLAVNDVSNVSCFGGNNGTATASASGGSMNYTFLWSTGETSETLTNLTAGTYMVTATDDNGCEGVIQFEVTQPDPIEIQSLDAGTISCFGDSTSVDVVAIGGTGNLTYEWSNGSTEANLVAVPAGNYSLTITDENNCIIAETVDIAEPEELVSVIASEDALCAGDTTFVTASIAGGTGDTDILWSTGETTNDVFFTTSGSYTATITDENGCERVTEVEVTIPEAIVYDAQISQETATGANDGAITLIISGGTGELSLLWNTGDTTSTIEGLSPGLYEVVIVDGNGCSLTEEFVVSAGGCALSVVAETTNVTCFGDDDGSILLNTFDVNGTAEYSWSNGDSLQMINDLAAGTYSVTISDSLGCLVVLEDIEVFTPDSLEIGNIAVENDQGSGNGSIELDVAGGTQPYVFQWINQFGDVVGSEKNLDNVAFGTYSLFVTDANMCELEVEVIVELESSIDEADLEEISLYPNPASSMFVLEGELQQVKEVSIINTIGQEFAISFDHQGNRIIADVSQIPTGVYFIRTDRKIVKKIFIE